MNNLIFIIAFCFSILLYIMLLRNFSYYLESSYISQKTGQNIFFPLNLSSIAYIKSLLK
jgi:hypothetical protein